jgi:predicted HTH transcriptional regulator
MYKHTNIIRYIPMNVHSKIFEVIKKEKVVTSSEIAKSLILSWNTAEKYLLELVIEGKILKIKKLGVNLWVLK